MEQIFSTILDRDFSENTPYKGFRSRFRPNERLMKVLLWLCYGLLGAEVILLLGVQLLFASPLEYLFELLELVKQLVQSIAIVIFIVWLNRTYFNLYQAKLKLKFDQEWSIFGWFVPIINLFYPYQMLKESWVKMHSFIDRHTEEGMELQNPAIILGWWVLVILAQIITALVMNYYVYSLTDLYLEGTTSMYLLMDSLTVLATLMTIVLFRKLQNLEGEFYYVATTLEQMEQPEAVVESEGDV